MYTTASIEPAFVAYLHEMYIRNMYNIYIYYCICMLAVYKEEEWPEFVLEIREFCLRHVREIKLKKEDREKNVL